MVEFSAAGNRVVFLGNLVGVTTVGVSLFFGLFVGFFEVGVYWVWGQGWDIPEKSL